MILLSERAKILLELAGGSVTELAKIAGVKPPSVSDWLNGKTKSLKGAPAARIVKKFNLNPTWVTEGIGAREASSTLPVPVASAMDNNVHAGPDFRGKVPLISWVRAGNWAEAIDNLAPGDAEEWIDTTVTVRQHTFALRVVGDSMEPDFPEGILLVVEPDLDPQPGDYVIAKNGEEATFKKLVKDGADWYLKPLNPRYPIKPLEGARIIGVVREAVRRFR
jgi:SOS-response transcriptional repressor LexA